MLHGFPGKLSKRNEDLGQYLASTLGVPVYLLHYRGLGQHLGKFSFVSTFDQAIAAFRAIEIEARAWTIVGHSWGGLVAAAVAGEVGVGRLEKLLLMSPFSFIPQGNDLEDLLAGMKAELPEVLGHMPLDVMVGELDLIRDHRDLKNNLVRLKLAREKLIILQATNDDVVPMWTTNLIVEALAKEVTFEAVTNDHSFLNDRAQFCEKILKLLQ